MKVLLSLSLLLVGSVASAGTQNMRANSDTLMTIAVLTLASHDAIAADTVSFDKSVVSGAKIFGLEVLDNGPKARPFDAQAMRTIFSKCQITGFHHVSWSQVTMSLRCIHDPEVYAEFQFNDEQPAKVSRVDFGAPPKINLYQKITDN